MEKTKNIPSGLSLAITESSFEGLFKSHFKELTVYAFTLLNDQELAEEMVQQVFYKVWEKKDAIVFDTSVKAYLYKSVYHSCLNHRKHLKVRKEHAQYALRQTEGQADNADVANKEMAARIQQAIETLPDQCKLIFQMSRFEELRYREIAERLNLSVRTVEVQMSKALRQLRLLLGKYLTTISAVLTYILNNN